MMRQKKWEIEFFTKRNGRCPTEDFLKKLNNREKAFVLNAIDRLEEHGLELGFPYVEHLRDSIWELRLRVGKIRFRVLYFIFEKDKFILMQGIKKKERKVKPKEINKAIEYRIEYLAEKGTRQL